MKSIFDKIVYRHIVHNSIDHIEHFFLRDKSFLKRNEALLYCWDIIPREYEPYITEINTNTAVDDDLVDWFDFNPIFEIVKKWEYKSIIDLIEERTQKIIEDGKWYKELQLLSKDTPVRIQTYDPWKGEDIWDFDYDKRDFILRIAWDKNCPIDKFAEDKLAFKKLLQKESLSTPKTGEDIYEKGKYFVFKKRDIDKKSGISISKFDTKKDFLSKLSEYDYVEEFIQSDLDYQTGFNVEVKHYSMIFRKDSYNMTPNVYTQLYDYHEHENSKFPNRVDHSNLFLNDEVDENIINKEIERVHPFHYRHFKINDEFEFVHSCSILVYQNNRGDFKPIHLLKVGDVLLRDGEKVKVEKIEIIKEQRRVKGITTLDNSLSYHGFQIQAKSDNFISGVDGIITNPLEGQSVLSSEEDKIVSAILAKAKDSEMPERVVEITFECSGTYFTSEFLFEKPLKVINSQDFNIRMDRTDGKEMFGTHNEAGVKKDKPTYGWASYKPELTYEVKNMMVMKLRPGMICLTPKRKDMKITQALYGEMVPCKVVSMKEVPGKKSHWDIYDILPTENYFMNRLKVHNGPAQYGLTSGPQIIGHWDIGHPSSFSSPANTIYDLTTRLDADLTIHTAPAPNPAQLANATAQNYPAIQPKYPNPEFKAIPLPESYKGARLTRQPGNPYHTQNLFNGQNPTTYMFAYARGPYLRPGSWPGTNTHYPNSPTRRRWMSHTTGTNGDMAVYPGQSGPGAQTYVYLGPSQTWKTVPVGFDAAPFADAAFAIPGPKSTTYYAKQKFMAMTLQSSNPRVGWYQDFDQPSPFVSGIMQTTHAFPTPQSNPRAPSNIVSFGGNAYPNPSSSDGDWIWSKVIIWDAVLPSAQVAAMAVNINSGHPNNRAYHEGGQLED